MARRKRAGTRRRGKSRSFAFKWQWLTRWWPSVATRRRWMRTLSHAPATLQLAVLGAVLVTLWFGLNWIYQVVRKPSELFFPVSGVLYKLPAATWDTYESAFRKHSTATIAPEFLAALAQIEAAGNPIARTYWRWSLSPRPFDVYRPASSAVGMYQITDGTFEETRRYCVHDHVVVEDGPWHDMRSCWFNGLYTRVIASHSIEMTSAYLDQRVARALSRARIAKATLRQKENLAAVIHLCGAGAGERFARRGLRLVAQQRCGDHDVRAYVNRVQGMKTVFLRLGADS
jgi:Transglycosylase SLT domain